MEGLPCFWILGLVLPLDGLLDTLYNNKEKKNAHALGLKIHVS